MTSNVQTLNLSFTEAERAIVSAAIESYLTPAHGDSKVFKDDDETSALITIHKRVNNNSIQIPVTRVSAIVLVNVVREHFVRTQQPDAKKLYLELSTIYDNYWCAGY